MEYSNAKQISNLEYMDLTDPEFLGQTRPNSAGEYRMYFKSGDQGYFTVNKI